MHANDPQTLIVAILLAIGVILVGVMVARERRKARSRHLQERFGPEYNHAVAAAGDREKAEAELAARETRVERLRLITLPAPEAAHFAQEWQKVQQQFVDNPSGAVAEAEHLVRELMLRRGYPMTDFERRAADLSVHHPAVVENYRAAQAIATRNVRGEANTEELRKAIVHYRALFEDLLEPNRRPMSQGRGISERNHETVKS
jgi:hypothetical protein